MARITRGAGFRRARPTPGAGLMAGRGMVQASGVSAFGPREMPDPARQMARQMPVTNTAPQTVELTRGQKRP